jgi:arylsulfatase A
MTIRVLITLVILGLTFCSPKKQAGEDIQLLKPNIIYILADDLGYGDLSSYGQKKFSTPHIDRLVSEGMMFTQHYSGSSVCAPARSSLMTGLHTGRTPIRGNKEVQPEGQWPLPDSIITLPKLLKQAGYVTGIYGKWGLGYPGSEGEPNNHFDEFFGYNCQRLAHHYYPYYLWHNKEKVMLTGNEGTAANDYGPEIIHQKALDFIEKHKDTPFFMFYASLIPHAELLAPEEYMALYRNKFLPERQYKGVDSGENFRLGPYGSQDECNAAFAAMVTVLDDQVGDLYRKIKELGIEKNTIIIFTSDNGAAREGGADPEYFNSSGPLKGFKRDLYEGGIRVPMVAWWPGHIEPAQVTDHVSAFWDVLPTFTDLAGVPSPSGLDGISFLPTLLGNEQKKHEYLYWEFHELGGRIALRMGNWKAVRYNVNTKNPQPTELYDLSNDIGETKNLAAENPEIVKEMEDLMKSARIPSSVFTFASETIIQ